MGSISTTRGDGGQTGLAGGVRVSKASVRVDAYGNIDELISTLGFARSICDDAAVVEFSRVVQRELFKIGSSLATPPQSTKPQVPIERELVDRLTAEVHRLEAIEGMLLDWSVSGAHAAAAAFDVARTVCRRAERGIVSLVESGETVDANILPYLNRLSDLLWLFGRKLELDAGVSGSLRAETGRTGNRWSRAWSVILLVGVLIGSGGGTAFAQTTLVGRVLDAQGAVVPDAQVRVEREDGGLVRVTATGSTGEYRVDALPPGIFLLEVAKPGFRRHADVVIVAAGESLTLDVDLEVAGIDDAVVVTAAGVPQVTQETSKAITIITSDEIQARNENSLADIVRFTPGVQVRNSGGPGQATSMRIRGLRPDGSAVLVDGMRFRDAATIQADATSFLSTLNFVAAERVEVLRGSGSSLYGTNAVGGVVNIVTRTGGGASRPEAQFEAGSLGHLRARGWLGGAAFGDRLRYSIGALQFNLLDGLDGNDSARSTGAQGMAQYEVSTSANLMVRVLASDDRVQLNTSPAVSGVPVANIPQMVVVDAIPVSPDRIARSNQGLPLQIGGATYIPGRDDPDSLRTSRFHTTALRFRHSGWAGLSLQASYQRVHTRRTVTNGPLGVGFQPAAVNYSNILGNIHTAELRAYSAPRPWLNVAFGYEFERERFHDFQDNNLPVPRRIQTETQIRQDGHTGFGSAQFALAGRRVQVSISGRAQRFGLSAPNLIASGIANPYSAIVVHSPPRALTADISAAYFVAASETKLRVHAGNAFRAPGLYERFGGGFSTDPVTGQLLFTAFGDPRLEPDRYQSVDVGVDQYAWSGRTMVSVTVFHNNISSLTAFNSSGGIRPDTDPFGRTQGYFNSSGGFSRGVEVQVEARPIADLRLSGGYTYTRSETDQDLTVPGFFLTPNIVGHMATFVASSNVTDRLDATFDLFYGSESYGSFFAAGRSRAYRYPGFTRAAVVAGYRVLDARRVPVRAYVKIDNLFDRTYYEIGWRNLGRTVVAGLSVGS